MSEKTRSTWAQVATTFIGGALVSAIVADIVLQGGVTWSKWRVAGYTVLGGFGLWFLHPQSGRFLAQQILDRFGGD